MNAKTIKTKGKTMRHWTQIRLNEIGKLRISYTEAGLNSNGLTARELSLVAKRFHKHYNRA